MKSCINVYAVLIAIQNFCISDIWECLFEQFKDMVLVKRKRPYACTINLQIKHTNNKIQQFIINK